MEHALHREEKGEEDGADADGGQQHRHEVLACRLNGGIEGLEALAKIFQIAVNHHDRVVDNHSQYHNECRQCHDIQFDAHHIHDRHGNESTQRNGDGCHNG